MLNIYVLEDHFIQQNRIEEVIHTILKKNNIKVGDFEVFDKPNQLLDFIDKSLEGEDFQKRLESIILLTCKKIQSQNPEDAFRIENVKTVIQVPFHDILYFETSDIVHKVILYTKEEQIEFYGSLSQIEKSDPRLFKCHKSFLINPENIIKLDKSTGTVYFENGGVCYVSKLKLKKLLERISLWQQSIFCWII